MEKSEILYFDKLATELKVANIVEANNPSDAIGLLFLNKGTASVKIAARTRAGNLKITTPLTNQNPTLEADRGNFVKFCLRAPEPSVLEISEANTTVLTQMKALGLISSDAQEANVFLLDKPNAYTTNVSIMFSNRFENNIEDGVVRKHWYFLDLGKTDVDLNGVIIKTTTYDAGTNDIIGQPDVLLDSSKLFKTSTDRIIYPMLVSELDTSTIVDIQIDFDGSHKLYLPTRHLVNLSISVEGNFQSSPVDIRVFDSVFLAELAGTNLNQKVEANTFSTKLISSTNNTVTKTADALFQYKMDTSIVLTQSFAIQFEKWLINDSANVNMKIGNTIYAKADILQNATLVNEKYYFIINITNQDKTGIIVNIDADYDGPLFNDFLKTNYRFNIFSNITPQPPIPMFALGTMLARIEIKDENTYFYDGYRFLQFKLPIHTPSVVKLQVELSASNFGIKPIQTTGTISPISDREELREFARLNPSDSAWTSEVEGKYSIWGFKEAGEAIFQVQIPAGLTGNLYFGITPVNSNNNLLRFNNDLMQIEGISNRIPSINFNEYGTWTVNIGSSNVSANNYFGAVMYDELLMPGMAISASKLTRFALIDERVNLTELVTWNDGVSSSNVIRNQNLYKKSISFESSYVSVQNGTPQLTINLLDSDKLNTTLTEATYVIFRTLDNRLLLIAYDVVNNIAIKVRKVIPLISNLTTYGYALSDGLRFAYRSKTSEQSHNVQVTKPYEVTYEELTTFEPSQTFEINTMVRVTDFFGLDALENS